MKRSKVSIIMLALTVVAVGLAGCTESDDRAQSGQPVAPAPPAAVDDETGGIEGLLTDDEGRPVDAAQVGILALNLATLTDAAGGFSLSHVPPGAHNLHVQRLGFEGVGRRIQVSAGEVTEVLIQLTPLPSAEPHKVLLTQRGIFGCGSSWTPGLPPEPAPGIPDNPVVGVPPRLAGLSGCGVVEDTPLEFLDQFLLVWELPESTVEWQSAVFEMKWESSQLAGRGLAMIWEVNDCPNSAPHRFLRSEGPSPLRGESDHEAVQGIVANGTLERDSCSAAAAQCHADSCKLMSRIFATPETTSSDEADIGVSFQQPYEAFLTAFYLEAAPEGYSALTE